MEKLDTPIVATRRKMLQKWIDDNYQDPFKQAQFIRDLEKRNPDVSINQGELAALLKNKSFGEKKARRLEMLAGMPNDYLDNMQGKIIKKLVDPDALAKTLMDAYNRLDDSGRHKLLVRASELILEQTNQTGTLFHPFKEIKPQQKVKLT